MAKIRFSDKVAEVQGQLAEGGFMDKPTLGDYMTVAAQNLATGLQAAEKERMIKEKEERAEAAAKAERIRKEQLEEEKQVKKLKAAINAALDIELGSKENIDWQWSNIEGGRPSVVSNIFSVLNANDVDPSQVSGYINLMYDRGAFDAAAIKRDISLDTQTIDDQTDSALGTTTTSSIKIGSSYTDDTNYFVEFGKTKVDLFAPANVATESTWQQSIADIQNATYGQLRKDAEISAIKQKAKDMGWVTVGDRTLKEVKDMKTSTEIEDWAATQNLNDEDATTVEAVIETKKDIEDKKLWFNQPVSKIIEWNYDGDSKNKGAILDAQIGLQLALSEDLNLLPQKRASAKEKYEKLMTAKSTIALLNGQAKFDEVSDLIPFMGKDVTELTNLRAMIVQLGAPDDVQQTMGLILSQAIEQRDAEEQKRMLLLEPKKIAYMDFVESEEYKEDLIKGVSIGDLSARFEKRWSQATSIAQQPKDWFEEPENLRSLTLDEVNLLINAQIVTENHPAYDTITKIKTSLEGAQTDDDIADLSTKISEAANKGPKALELLALETGAASLLTNDTLADQYSKAMAIANAYTEPEEIDEYQMVLRAAIAEAEENNVDFSTMSSGDISKFFGEVKLNYDAARTATKDENYGIEEFQSELVKYSLALANNPNDKAAKDWLNKQAPIIESSLLRVSGMNDEAKMLAKLRNRGLDDTDENRRLIASADDLKITTSFSGFPMIVNKLTSDATIIGSGDDTANIPATMDNLDNTLTDMKNNPNEYNYIGKVSVAEDGALTIDVRNGQTITLTADQIRESAEFDKELAMSQSVQEGIPMSQGPGSYIRQGLAAISDITFGLPPESDRAKTTAAIGFLEKLKINTILKLSAAQGTRDSVWQKQALSITLPERGLLKGNQLALQDFENTLSGLIETKNILDDIMTEAKTPEGATDKSITAKSARTLKDINSLIPVYQEVVRLFKEGGATSDKSSGSGKSGNIQDLNLQKGSFTTGEGENR